MTSNQEAKLNMYHAVINYCDANAVITATVPAFDTQLTAFKAKVSSIDTTAQLEAQVITGVSADKKTLRQTLAQQAADIGAVVYAYATSVSNNTLAEQVNFSRSELLRLKDDELAPTCQNIHDAANDNIAALATYGITAPMLTDFQTLIDDYIAAVPTPRNAAAQRKTYATTLKTLFKEADAILKPQMDKTAVQFKLANLDFYTTYKNNRIIIDAGSSTTKADGTITDSVTSNPIGGVIITVDGQTFTTTSATDGTFSLKIPVPGTYTIIFTKTGYQTKQTTNVVITLGQTTPLDTQLTPA